MSLPASGLLSDPLQPFLDLSRQARDGRREAELDFLLVNATHALAPYRQAVLFRAGRVRRLSGVSVVERQAPLVQALEGWHRAGLAALSTPSVVDADDDRLEGLSARRGLWLPAGGAGDGVLFLRDIPWTATETGWMAEWTGVWAHAVETARARETAAGGLFRRRARRGRGRALLALAFLAAVVAALALVKVPLTVLAPAELVPKDPVAVRAPVEGVVAEMFVQPGQRVAAGDRLFEYERAVADGRLQVARQALATAQTEYRQALQQAVVDPRAHAQLQPLQGRIRERQAELEALARQQQRTVVTAPADGVVMLDDASAWKGRPVAVGERVLRIATGRETEVELWVGLDDLVPLAPGTTLRMHPNPDPLSPVDATLLHLSHEAVARPDGGLAYRGRAALSRATHLAVGVKGTARLDGEPVTLGYWLFRRPLSAARQTIGL